MLFLSLFTFSCFLDAEVLFISCQLLFLGCAFWVCLDWLGVPAVGLLFVVDIDFCVVYCCFVLV